MKKTYKLLDLDCAACAAKLEDRIKKLPGIVDASVSFITQRMTIETESEDQSDIMKEVVRVCHRVEPDCKILL